MGTEKRERQKANRQMRLVEKARADRTAKVRRSIVRWSITGVLGVGAVVLIAWIGGAFSGSDDESDLDSVLDAPVLTVPQVTAPPETAPPVSNPPDVTTPADATTGKPSVVLPETTPAELVVTDIVEGEGEPAAVGDTVEVNYVGVRSADGVEFDNSYDRGQTYPVTLGAGGVIPGWDQGLVGVKVGGMRQLDIPADLAYGEFGAGGLIRPGETLSFVVEVVSITPAEPTATSVATDTTESSGS